MFKYLIFLSLWSFYIYNICLVTSQQCYWIQRFEAFWYKKGIFKNVIRKIKRLWPCGVFFFFFSTALVYSTYSIHPHKRPHDFSPFYRTDWKDALSTESGPCGIWNSFSLTQSKQISFHCQQRSSGGPYKPARNQQMFMSGWVIRTSCLNWCVFS